MKTKSSQLPFAVTVTVVVAAVTPVCAALRYVNVNSASPASPYTNWATAATNIQDAIDAATIGDEVVVTNGVYQTGGRVAVGLVTNRVAVTKPITIRSVNGPAVTLIVGHQLSGLFPTGVSAVRCVYLTNGAALIGFTLTNGATRRTGFPVDDKSGGGVWCESTSALVSNCVLSGNAALFGGGSYRGILDNCTFVRNEASEGGGANGSTLKNCTLISNAASYGGGTYQGSQSNCFFSGNSAVNYGGGASGGTLYNSTFIGNSGSAVNEATLHNCLITGNSGQYGGGANGGTLNNCTLTGNSATFGGGAYESTLNNCIIYYNVGLLGANHLGGTFNYSCTTPLPFGGVENISAEPQLASASRLSSNSPCRGGGGAAYATGADMDGEVWANPPSIGCDEFHSGAITSALSVAIMASYTNVATGFEVRFTAQIGGRASLSLWEFGDGTAVSNRPFTSHLWSGAGDFPAVLWAFNESYPRGISATVSVHVVERPVHFVALNSRNPSAPFDSWATAATNIQDAVNAASTVGALVLVSNGVYQTGGHAVYGSMTNRVAVTKQLTVRSVNGPAVTVIEGYQVPGTKNGDSAVRCAYLSDGAVLVGFTLTNGGTRYSSTIEDGSGGGVWCESTSAVVSNCVFSGNSAAESGGAAYQGTLNNCSIISNSVQSTSGEGGGAAWATLNNCWLAGNSATYGGGAFRSALNNCLVVSNAASVGGGTFDCVLNNCTLTRNSASQGGGASWRTMNNCIVYDNTGSNGANYSQVACNCSCTTPLPSGGLGNFTNAPLFLDATNGNLRLQSDSPCIDTGFTPSVPGGFDLDGHARIVGGAVDLGAYEFQIAPPRLGLERVSSGGLLIRLNGVNGLTYLLQRATNVTGPWVSIATNTALTPGVIEFHDTNTPPGSAFYRTATAP